MKTPNELLLEIHSITEKLINQLTTINENMELNDPEKVELLLEEIEHRGFLFDQLIDLVNKEPVLWNSKEKIYLQETVEWEAEIKATMAKLYSSFSEQIQKLEQGKQVSHKYHNPYEKVLDGVYFDKRN